VPTTKKGKPASTRVEYRSPDPACNPYLAFSVIIAAGIAGIENGYDLPEEIAADATDFTTEERLAVGINRIPDNLASALDAMESSELVAEALGEHLFEWFLRNKRNEWDTYQRHVSRLEVEEYLPIL